MVKRTSDTSQSEPERAAQRWHKRHHSSREASYGECWCCCDDCKFQNPHRTAACCAALADIQARINDSMNNVQMPPKSPAQVTGP